MLAIQLLKGKAWARLTCIICSVIRLFILLGLPFSLASLWLFIIRVLTLVGVPISLISLYVLCRNRTAKAFFGGEGGRGKRGQVWN